MENQLQVLVKESGLEQTKAKVLLDNFQNYFEIASEWEIKAKNIVVTDASQKVDMEMARTGRLFLREKRINIEKKRKELKEQSLREGKAIDGIANILKALIVPIEEYLDSQEKFVEIEEEKKREAMRLEAEKKEEDERIKQEKIAVLHQERRELLLPYLEWWEEELKTANLGELSQSGFDNILTSLKQEKADYDKEQERIRLENEKLQKEAQEKERKHQEEKAKAEEEKRALEVKAQKEREAAEAKQRAIEERARKEKEAAEAKAETERKANEEKIRKQKETAEKAAREAKEKADAEKRRLEEQLKNQIECPKCHHKFQRGDK